MECEDCGIPFASKYTLERHMERKHGNRNQPPEILADNRSDNRSDAGSDDSRSEVSDNASDRSSTADDENDSEEEEDYWAKIIRLTAQNIWYTNMMNNDSGVIAGITHVSQFLKGKFPIVLCGKIREMDKKILEIRLASHNDTLHDSIKQKMNRELEAYEDLDSEEKYKDAFKEQASIAAWKHFKYMIKQKNEENIDSFDILVDNSMNESDSEPSTSMA